jgi:hypothetical protein
MNGEQRFWISALSFWTALLSLGRLEATSLYGLLMTFTCSFVGNREIRDVFFVMLLLVSNRP